MQTFAYVALDPAGRRKSGVTEASTADAAIAAISAEGRFVVEIKASKPEASAGEKVGRRRASKADLALFTRRMADLAAAGLPLDRVLQVVAEQSESSELRRVAEGALVEVRGGMPVSEALAQHPRLFPQVYTQTLRAGEASGQFAQVAERLAQFQETEVERKSKIVSAMIYPGVLTVTAVGVVVFLVTFVIPKLVVVFKDLGGDLPLSTKMLLLFTDFVSAKGLFLLGGIVAATVFYRALVATETGASARDALLLHSPMLGPVMTKATVSRF
ncbi:MAG: type II secretion system F family protein, partial [Fimbriimonas ginsengisoli]|nr:type II secretion system F family protein [Fimbriimonas ginsengisoli]